jgi:hypothetical protein
MSNPATALVRRKAQGTLYVFELVIGDEFIQMCTIVMKRILKCYENMLEIY